MERNNHIDVVKGIGILLVVMGHAPLGILKFADLFHVPIFFIAAGYCYKDTYAESVEEIRKYIIKKIKGLYVPYVSINIIFLCLHNIFVKWNFYSPNMQLVNQYPGNSLIDYYSVSEFVKQFILIIGFVGGEQLAGAVWFLRVLFEISIIYVIIDYISGKLKSNKLVVNSVVSVTFLCLGYWLSINEIKIVGGLHIACSCLIFFHIGVLLKKFNEWEEKMSWWTFLLSSIILVFHAQRGGISIAINTYASPIWLLSNALLGWIWAWSISNIIQKTKFGNMLRYIGKKSLFILLLHFISFKLVTFIFISVMELPSYILAVFPVLPYGGIWYVLAGVGMPLMVEKIYSGLWKWTQNQAHVVVFDYKKKSG